jgi:translation initiation factor 5B
MGLLLAPTFLEQSLIKTSNSATKSKKDKKQKAKAIDVNDDEDQNTERSVSKAPEFTADEQIEDEWGPVKEKKKGKVKTDARVEDDEQNGLSTRIYLITFLDALPEDPTTAEPQTTLERENENPDEVDESNIKVLSKKEKEKLKKEREKVVCVSLPCYLSFI